MTMSSIGLPALNGFIGELLILQGVFVASRIWAVFAASGVVLGAAYMLWLYQRTMFGKVENPKNERLSDLNMRELATYAPLADSRRVDWPLSKAIHRPAPDVGRSRGDAHQSGIPRCGRFRVPGSRFRVLGSGFTVRCPAERGTRKPEPGTRNAEPGTSGSALVPAGINLSDFYYLMPEIVLTAGALLLLVADLLVPRDRQSVLAGVTLAILAATAAALVPVADAHLQVSKGLIAVDRFALFFKVIFLASAALTVLMSVRYLEVEGTQSR